MLRFCFLLLVVYMASCGHHAGPSSTAKSGSTPISETGQPLGDFYKRYSGTIDGKPVVVQLQCWNGLLAGSWHYVATGQTLMLTSLADSPGIEAMILAETPADARHQEPAATWSIIINGSHASGSWHSGDGTIILPVELTETYPPGSVKLDAFHLADSIKLSAQSANSPKAIATNSFLLPAGHTRNYLYYSIRSLLAPGGKDDDDIATAIQAENRNYFDDYINLNGSIYKEKVGQQEIFSFNYSIDKRLSILYNENDLVVVQYFVASYTGGAHSSYSASYVNIDMMQQRRWGITDIVADSTVLKPMLNDAAIQYFGLNRGEGSERRLLVDDVPTTGNVFISETGLTFVYNPYEIASFADGQVFLFLSYKQLFPFLTPAFKARMRLTGNAGVAIRKRSINLHNHGRIT